MIIKIKSKLTSNLILNQLEPNMYLLYDAEVCKKQDVMWTGL